MTASAQRERNGRIACSSSGSSPAISAETSRAAGRHRARRLVPVRGSPAAAARHRATASRRGGSPPSSIASCVRMASAVERTRKRRSLQSIGTWSNVRIGLPAGERLVEVRRRRDSWPAAARATAPGAAAAAAGSAGRSPARDRADPLSAAGARRISRGSASVRVRRGRSTVEILALVDRRMGKDCHQSTGPAGSANRARLAFAASR